MKNVSATFILTCILALMQGRLHAENKTVVAAEPAPAVANEERELPQVNASTVEEIAAAMERGIDFLLADQNANGSWGSATRTKGLNIYAPVPGAHDAFRTATTALCISALLEYNSDRVDVAKSLRNAEDWLVANLPDLKRAQGDAIYNVWGHGYSIQALVRLHQHYANNTQKQESFEALIRMQFDRLSRYESVDGGWGYYDFRYKAQRPTASSISFVNGAILIAFAEAKEIGMEPPERVVRRAIAATTRQKKKDFSYLYGEYLNMRPMRGINRPGGSLGRTQCCNCALRTWGDASITDDVVKSWLVRLYVRNGWLDIGRKRPIPHEAWFQVAGYFYYYGHYYAALSLEQLPKAEQPPYQQMLARLMLDRQEKNGSWWDYPLYDYHDAYGTAFALMTLQRCLPNGSPDAL